MIRPATKHTVEILGGLLALLVIGAVLLVAKLSSGPLSLRFLAPSFAAVLHDAAPDYDVDVANAIVRWSKEDHALEIRVLGVTFADTSGTQVASIPELEIGLALDGLRRGVLAPTRVNIDKASAIVERDENGAFSIGAAGGGEAGSGVSVLLERILADGDRSAVGYLSEVVVEDADLTLIDKRTGIIVRAPSSRLALQRTAKGFSSRIEAAARVADEEVTIVLDGDYDMSAKRGALNVKFSPIRLSHLAEASEFYKGFEPFDIPVSGSAYLDLGSGAVITRAELSLTAENGAVMPPGEGAWPIVVQSASFNGTYWPQTGHVVVYWLNFDASGNRAQVSGDLQLRSAVVDGVFGITSVEGKLRAANIGVVWPERFPEPLAFETAAFDGKFTPGATWGLDIASASLVFGDTRMDVAGRVAEGEGSPAIKLDGQLADFNVENLADLWPLELAPNARRWVTQHVHAGELTKGVLKIDAPAGAFAAETVDDRILNFAFHVENGNASYSLGMPPLTDLAADMVLTPNRFHLDLLRARILKNNLTAGSVDIAEIGVKGSPIEVKATANGAIDEILRVIDSEPMRLVSDYGMAPENITGNATLEFAMTVPQLTGPEEDDIAFAVKAHGTDVKIVGLRENLVIDQGTLDLDVDHHGLLGRGTAAINGSPAEIAWRETFMDDAPKPSEFSVKATLNDAGRASLGIDTGQYVTGPVVFEAVARGNGPKIEDVSAKLDLTRAVIDFGEFAWTKAEGKDARAALEVVIAADGATTLTSLVAEGEGIDVSGSAALAADWRLTAADFERLKLEGLVDASVHVARGDHNGLIAEVDGRFLNLGPILKRVMEQEAEEGAKIPWRVDGNLASVLLREGVVARNLQAQLASTGERLTAVAVRGEFADGESFHADITGKSEGARWLMVGSDDAGDLIKGMTGVGSIIGGRLALNVRLADAASPQRGQRAPPSAPPAELGSAAGTPRPQTGTTGTLRIDDFTVVDAPILARLLTIGSLQGISDLLNGEGIEFTHLEMPFWLEHGRLGIEDGRAAGPSIGLTLQGVVDRRAKETDLNGTVVPAYALNSMWGNVPVLGQLLISRQGEGVFGFTYGVAGAMDEPRVTVNPLSALAPGFLRRIFELGETQAGDLRSAPEQQPTTAQ